MIVKIFLVVSFLLATSSNIANSAPTNPQGSCGTGKIDTAIGCIPVESNQEFAGFLLGWGIGLAGGIALIMIAYSGFMISTSGGNPNKLQAGKELFSASITGLLFLVFSVYILRLIGVTIFGLPGLT